MQSWVVPLIKNLPASQVGRKAAVLGRLIEAGFPVPPSVCITTDAFQAAALDNSGVLRLPVGLLDALVGLLPVNIPLAVRSSTEMEDLPDASLAGRFGTRLNVIVDGALERAILECWKSYLDAPEASRKGSIAILVQPLLDAECAGVCFTVDPVRLRPDLLMVASSWGQGAGVVGGSIPTDLARLRRTDLGIEDISVADKHTALRPAQFGGGLTSTLVSDELRSIPCLPESWLERVGQFGLAIEQIFGAPQDVEWAVADGKLWILQSRPITTLTNEIRETVRFPMPWENEEEPRHFWWLWRAHDSAGSPLLPAELEFVRTSTRGSLEAVNLAGHPDTRWLKFVSGRVYMAVAKSPNAPGRVRVYGAANRELYERLAKQDVTQWEFWGPEIVSAAERLASFDRRRADGSVLADHLDDIIAAANRHWMVHTVGPRPIRSAALLDIYARMSGKRPEEAKADIPFLLAGAETIQTRLIEALYELAYMALKDPEKNHAISALYPDVPTLDPPDAQLFAAAFANLMRVYGGRLCYRTFSGYPVDLPLPWREAPEHVWELIASYMPLARQSDRPSPHQAREQARRVAESRLEALCATASDPALVEDFRRKLAYARRNAAGLDEQNHYIDQLSEGEFYQALIHAGRWLAESDNLDNAFDVFWLEVEEILNALRGNPVEFKRIISTRKADFQEWEALIPPACFGLPDPLLSDRPKANVESLNPAFDTGESSPNVLRGEPASRGNVSGRACVIDKENSLPTVTAGEVLIAPFIGAAVIPGLPALAALVLDFGSPGDHAAILAREFGLPVVCSTHNATRRIPDGAWVTVDADTGLVTWK